MTSSETKSCSRCKRDLPLEEFHKRTPTPRDPSTLQRYCKCCQREVGRAAYARDPEKFKARNRKPVLVTVAGVTAEVSAASHRDFLAALRRFGLTIDDYERILREQGGGCAICGSRSPASRCRRFMLDHDHETGVFRGLLCAHCNLGLGQFGDSPDTLERAARYLRSISQADAVPA